MSNFVIYLRLEPFVKQWLVHHYGEPVSFPPQSVENSTIRLFLQKLPEGKVPEIKKEEEIAICIPESKQKPVEYYNYLGKHAKEALIECIEDNFKRNMWSELNDLHDCGCTVQKAIDAWCEMHGISIDFDDTIRQRYYRARDAYLKHGIDLRKRKRNHNIEDS